MRGGNDIGSLDAWRDIAYNTKEMHLHYTYAHFILYNTTMEDTPIRPPVCVCVCVGGCELFVS